jgi:hypothetical protein
MDDDGICRLTPETNLDDDSLPSSVLFFCDNVSNW